jgi:hypothetical protein
MISEWLTFHEAICRSVLSAKQVSEAIFSPACLSISVHEFGASMAPEAGDSAFANPPGAS